MSGIDWIGSVGVFLILMAYFFSTFQWMSSQSQLFFALNTIGAAMTCYASYLIHYWPFAVLEGTWMIVSLTGWLKAKRTI